METSVKIYNPALTAVSPTEYNRGVASIVNLTYDVVFKYLLEDNAIAKLMVSTIIREEVVSLAPNPQEYTAEKIKIGEGVFLTVYQLDFSAKIKTPDGYQLVLPLSLKNLPRTVRMSKEAVMTAISFFNFKNI